MKVSFDFDDTLQSSLEPDRNFPMNNWHGAINRNIEELVHFHANRGDEVIIVSTRYDIEENKQEIEEFIKIHKLPIKDIFLTNFKWKRNTLKRLKVDMHFDDNLDELKRLKHTSVKGIHVKDQKYDC